MGGHNYTDLKEVEKFYNECKLIVLKWEKAFAASESRQPSKADMQQAPARVKSAYEKYCKYKKIVTKLRAKAAKEGKHSKHVTNTTPQKIFRSLSFRIKGVEESAPGPSQTKKKHIPFGRTLSEKLFASEPSSLKKRTKSSANLNPAPVVDDAIVAAQDGENLESVKNSSEYVPDVNSSGMDSGIASENSNPMETDSEEMSADVSGCLSKVVENSAFVKDSFVFETCDDEDFEVDTSFFSNFLQESEATSDVPMFNAPVSNVSFENFQPCLPAPTPWLPCLDSQPAPVAPFQSDSSLCIGEEVRRCLNTLNAPANEGDVFVGDDEFYFPSTSFISRNNVTAPPAPPDFNDDYDANNAYSLRFENELIPLKISLPPNVGNELKIRDDKENRDDMEVEPTPPKRKYSNVFTPSPKKETKKKFFKSDKNNRISVRINQMARSAALAAATAAEEKEEYIPSLRSPEEIEPRASSSKASNKKQQKEAKDPSAAKSKRTKKASVTVTKKVQQKKSTVTVKKTPGKAEAVINPSSSTNIVTDTFTVEPSEGGSKDPGFRGRTKKFRSRPCKTVNENYVAIDVSKKVFMRRKKAMPGWKAKRLDWKNKKTLVARELKLSSITCRNCGDIGHFSKFCPKKTSELQTEALAEIVDDSPWPTLEEAARMVWNKPSTDIRTTRAVVYPTATTTETSVETAESSTMELSLDDVNIENVSSTQSTFKLITPNFVTVNSYFEPTDSLDDPEVCQQLEEGLKTFGYTSFRPGQREAIFRILKGESTLLTLSTGSGKSLCYQLPAYLYSKKYPGCVTICISPLISLMEDQVESMPTFLTAAALSRNITDKKKDAILDGIRARKYQVLLVSPEAVSAGMFGLLRDADQMPPVAFACIDEVHCVTEWSHNFRPAYFQVCKLLREKLGVSTLLGLTATATAQTIAGICEQLRISEDNVIKGEFIPKNLKLSVSRDLDRDVALIRLLNGDRFRDSESIIIYCTRREECNRIAELVRVYTKHPNQEAVMKGKSRGKISSACESYHAGLTAAKRTAIQKNFMQGHIRTVVATVAFGMGIDKSDIRAVIHYNMPQTFESYVQEIGRAGRDGKEANCHLFLDNTKGRDLSELKRHVFANSVDRVTIRKLLKKIFKPCVCKKIGNLTNELDSEEDDKVAKNCPGHEVTFSVQKTVQELDLPEENIETLLCYLENDKQKFIEILPKTYELCKIHSYGGTKLLKASALKCPPLAVAIALEKEKKKFGDEDVYIEFNYVDAAAAVGWNSAVVRKELKSLEWTGSAYNASGQPTKFRKSGLIVEFTELAFRCRARGNLTSEEHECAFSSLCEFNANQERRQLYQLHKVYQSLLSVSTPGVSQAEDECIEEYSDQLRAMIEEYFTDTNGVPASWKAPVQGAEREEDVRKEVRNLLLNYKEDNFTGKSIAKLFQGISSPNFQALDWCRNKTFWRRFLDVDFHLLSKIASEEIVSQT